MANDEEKPKKATKIAGKMLKKGKAKAKSTQKPTKPFLGSNLTRTLNKSKRPRKKQ